VKTCAICPQPTLTYYCTHHKKQRSRSRSKRRRLRKRCSVCNGPVTTGVKYCDEHRLAIDRERRRTRKRVARDKLRASNPLEYSLKQRARKLRVGWQDLLSLLEAQQYRCAYTGELLTVGTMHLDHVVPRSRGGNNSVSNLQWITARINRMKSDLDHGEFLRLCEEIVERWQSKQSQLRIA